MIRLKLSRCSPLAVETDKKDTKIEALYSACRSDIIRKSALTDGQDMVPKVWGFSVVR